MKKELKRFDYSENTLQDFLKFAVDKYNENGYNAEAEKLKTLSENEISLMLFNSWVKLAKDIYDEKNLSDEEGENENADYLK